MLNLKFIESCILYGALEVKKKKVKEPTTELGRSTVTHMVFSLVVALQCSPDPLLLPTALSQVSGGLRPGDPAPPCALQIAI